MVKNLLCNTKDAGSVPARWTKSPHVQGPLSLRAAAAEPARSRTRVRREGQHKKNRLGGDGGTQPRSLPCESSSLWADVL